MRPFFYGVYLKDSQLATALDLVRFLSEPDDIRFSHVTLRGPLSRKLAESWIDQQNENAKFDWRIKLVKPGRFMSETQATVFIGVDLGALTPLWHKPDFPDGVPHITLYDGRSQDYATKLRNVLGKYDFESWVSATKLQKIQKKHRVDEVFYASFEPFCRMFAECIGDPVRIPKIRYAKENDRLHMVDAVLSHSFSAPALERRWA